MADGREPIALAMVLCDAIYRERATGKCTLLGTFSVVRSDNLPVSTGLSVYVCLTECRGEVPFTLRIIDVDESRPPVFQNQGIVNLDDPLGIAELCMMIGLATFPQAGEYRVQLLSDDHPIIERRLIVIQDTPEGVSSDG